MSVHEAAHAVFLNLLGYDVGPAGVWVHQSGGCCDFEEPPADADTALISLAGILAEWEWTHPGSQIDAKDWQSARHHLRHLKDAVYLPNSDSARAAHLSSEIRPSDPDGVLTEWIMQVREILRIPGVWDSIESVASLLSDECSLNFIQVTTTIERSPFLAHRLHIRRALRALGP